jgi:hypothetical protein
MNRNQEISILIESEIFRPFDYNEWWNTSALPPPLCLDVRQHTDSKIYKYL